MCIPPHTRKGDRGFTLVELLVVITIIAVLIGLLFPVAGAVMNNSRKTQASADEARIINACMNYKTDYDRLPVNPKNSGFETCYGDSPTPLFPGFELFDILRAIPDNLNDKYNSGNALNPKKVVYFQGPNVKNPNDPRGGFLVKDHNDGTYTIKAGSFVDPWGDEYITFLDTGTAGNLNYLIGEFYTDNKNYNTDQFPPGPVQVASVGADNGLGVNGNQHLKGSDDVVTW